MATSPNAAAVPRGTHANTPKRSTGKWPSYSPPAFSTDMSDISPIVQGGSPPVFGPDMLPSAREHIFLVSNAMADHQVRGTAAPQRHNAPPATVSSPQIVGKAAGASSHKGHAKVSTESVVTSHFPSLQTPSPAPKKADTLEVTL